MSNSSKPKIFISYSHEDEQWMELFAKKLKARFQNSFDIWHDREIRLGEEWFDKIINSIHDTKIAVLLISDDFLLSNFIQKEEIPKFRQLAKEKKLKLVPVIIRSCAWNEYGWLSSIQGYPKDNRPLSKFQKQTHLTFDKCPEIEDELTRLTERIKLEYEEEIKNPKIPTDIEKFLDKIQNYLHKDNIPINYLKQIAKKYLNDEVSQRNIDNQETFLDILSFLDGHDKEPLPCVINEIYSNSEINDQEIKEWLNENYRQNHCENLYTEEATFKEDSIYNDRIILRFNVVDNTNNKVKVYIRFFVNGGFKSAYEEILKDNNDDDKYVGRDIESKSFQTDLIKYIYDDLAFYQDLDIVLPKDLMLCDIKQWSYKEDEDTTISLTDDICVNIRSYERYERMRRFKEQLEKKWKEVLEQNHIPIENSLEEVTDYSQKINMNVTKAGLSFVYEPSKDKIANFYDKIKTKMVVIRCGEKSKFSNYLLWLKNNKSKLELKDLKKEIDNPDNSHITLIWDDPNIPL